MGNSIRWYFATPGPVQRQRNSKLDEHFDGSGADRAGDLVREGGQNSWDARNDTPVRIRISFGSLPRDRSLKYAAGLREHAASVQQQRRSGGVTAALDDGPCKFLVFEDFNTTGLTGNHTVLRRYDDEPPNSFHTFFRAEGQTDKVDGSKQGSKGVGKVTFLAASKARALFGLTTRRDNRTLLFGTCVLHTHKHENKDYDGDGWYGIDHGAAGVMPIEDAETIEAFRRDFNLSRRNGEPGLSVVVPWLHTDEESGVTLDHVIDATLRSHVWLILEGHLVVEIVSEDGSAITINAASFKSILERRDDDLKRHMLPLAELGAWALKHKPDADWQRLTLHERGAPKWVESLMSAEQRDRLQASFDAGDPIAVRVPVRIRPKDGKPETTSFFDVFLQQDHEAATSLAHAVHFVRGGLLITGMAKRVGGIRGIVLADDAGLAGFLRDAENPSHTKWNSKAIKDKYIVAPGTLNFVLHAAKQLKEILTGASGESQPVWVDKLNIPAGDLRNRKSKGRGPRGVGKPEITKEPPQPPPPPTPPAAKRPYEIRAIDGGFTISASGQPFTTSLPARLELRLAYHVRGRNPLSRWQKNDFDLQQQRKFPTQAVGCALEECRDNRLILRIDDPVQFKFTMTGFDVRRELFCKPKLLRGGGTDAHDDSEETEDLEAVASVAGGGAS